MLCGREVTTGLAESNGSLPQAGGLTVTCRLTAYTPGSAPGLSLGVEYGKTVSHAVMGNSRSLATSTFNTLHTTYYQY